MVRQVYNAQIYQPSQRNSDGDIPTPIRLARIYEGQGLTTEQIKLHADCLAAAPSLAAILIQEQTNHGIKANAMEGEIAAKDAEIARLQSALNQADALVPKSEHIDAFTNDAVRGLLLRIGNIVGQALGEATP